MKRLVRVTETTITDILIECNDDDNAEALVQAYYGLYGIDPVSNYSETNFEDITEKDGGEIIAENPDMTLNKGDYDREMLLKEIG